MVLLWLCQFITCLSSMYKIYETNTFKSSCKQRRQQKGATNWSGGAAVRIKGWFWADSQSDCSENMPPLSMRNMSCSLTNEISDILYVDDNIMSL